MHTLERIKRVVGGYAVSKKPNVTLDVYSSCDVYGSEFAKNNDDNFTTLYELAKNYPMLITLVMYLTKKY